MTRAIMVFKGCPIPPSSNNQYRSFVKHGRIIHVSSKELVQFKKDFDAYHLKNLPSFEFAREAFSGLPLSIHISFGFERSRLFTKKGYFKRLDVSNRLKAIHDCFARALQIDDSSFVRVSAVKYAVQKAEDEEAHIEIAVWDFLEVGAETHVPPDQVTGNKPN